MPTKPADEYKSKLLDRLRQISRGASAPLGFSRAAEISTPAMIVVAVLPRNDPSLAEAAVRAGADAIALRLCGAGTDFLKETGGFAAEGPAIKEVVAALGDRAIVGVVIGSNGNMTSDELTEAAGSGIDFLAMYPHVTPASFLDLSNVGRLAILDQQGGNAVRGINELSIQAVLFRTERPPDSPSEMTVLDVASFRGAADGIHRPLVAFPSWRLKPTDLEVLKNAGIEGVALVGPDPDANAEAVEAAVRPYREVVTRLGKPTGRRVALADPAVILPRAALGTGGGIEEDDDDEGEE